MTDLNQLFKDLAKNQKSNKVQPVSEINTLIKNQSLNWKATKTPGAKLPPSKQKNMLGVDATQEEVLKEEKKTAVAETYTRRVSHGKATNWQSHGGKNYVTPARDQGQCNACVSFATAGAIEANLRIQKKNPGLKISLSPASMNFCRPNGDCKRGWSLKSGVEWAKSNGVLYEACYPWSKGGPCSKRCADWKKQTVKIADFGTHRTLADRKAAIDQGPVIAGMFAFSDFLAYKEGIYTKARGAKPLGFHAVVIIGYNDKKGYWIIKNSQGQDWGYKGFGMVAYGQEDVKLDNAFPFYSIGKVILP